MRGIIGTKLFILVSGGKQIRDSSKIIGNVLGESLVVFVVLIPRFNEKSIFYFPRGSDQQICKELIYRQGLRNDFLKEHLFGNLIGDTGFDVFGDCRDM